MTALRRYIHYVAIVLFVLYAHAVTAQAPVYGYKVVKKYPHATANFTEGLLYLNDLLYEGTGSTYSAVVVTKLETGREVQRRDLPSQYFGEGIVDWGPNLYEWTWQSHEGFVLDRRSLKQLATFSYTGEGWGMTHDVTRLITSDGSSTLTFRDPLNFNPVWQIVVHDGSQQIDQLNELEYIKDEIWANVWHSNRIARISPQDGHIISWVDLSGILPEKEKVDAEAVLNGIAYDAKHDRIFVTGKRWPAIFEIKVLQK